MGKRKKVIDPEIVGTRYIPKKFAQDHCYRYPWKKAERQEYLFFLINLFAPSRSGYLVETDKKMWRNPNLTTDPERAFVYLVHPIDIGEATIRRQYVIPKNYVLVLIPKTEATRWYQNKTARKDAQNPIHGEIRYY